MKNEVRKQSTKSYNIYVSLLQSPSLTIYTYMRLCMCEKTVKIGGIITT